MSLEWARARLLQHGAALRKLCEAQAAARAQQRAVEHPQCTAVPELRKESLLRPVTDASHSCTVLAFGPPGRRRRA